MAQKTVMADLACAGTITPHANRSETIEVSVNDLSKGEPVLAEHEKWLYENSEALAAVKRGLADAAAGRVHRMSFAEYADIMLEE